MKNERIKIILVIISLFLIVGICSGFHAEPIKPSIPSADIVYKTIQDDHDLLGFYEIVSNQTSILDVGSLVHLPIPVGPSAIAVEVKKGNPANLNSFMSYLIYIEDGDTVKDCYKISANSSQMINGKIITSSSTEIGIVDSVMCTLEPIVTISQLRKYLPIRNILDFSISSDMRVMVFRSSEYPSIIMLDRSNNAIYDTKISGYNPAISPDGKSIVYVTNDGIYLLNLADMSSQKIVHNYLDRWSQSEFIDTSYWPRPQWSHNGEEIVYHRTKGPLFESCYCIDDFNAYVYNLATKEESILIQKAFNPAWMIK